MKCVLFETESTTVIIISNLVDFMSFTIKSILMVSHLKFCTDSKYSSLKGK